MDGSHLQDPDRDEPPRQAGVEHVLHLATARGLGDLEPVRAFDRAVRAWATHEELAAEAVARVDARRYRFVRELLEAYGMRREAAAIRGRLLYTALVGEQHISLKLSPKRRVGWALANLELLLTAT